MKAEGIGPAPQHVPARTHLVVALVLAVLTLFAFLAAGERWISTGTLVPILLALAFVQIALQALYYMRLRVSSRLFAGFFAAGIVLACLFAVVLKILLPL
jgi:heme/copper-type cytochrome/quinol oxidase subunit 4